MFYLSTSTADLRAAQARIFALCFVTLFGCADEERSWPAPVEGPRTLVESNGELDPPPENSDPRVMVPEETPPGSLPEVAPPPMETPEPEMATPESEPTPEMQAPEASDDVVGIPVESCDFNYPSVQAAGRAGSGGGARGVEMPAHVDGRADAVSAIVHAEPLPAYTWRMDRRLDRVPTPRPGVQVQNGVDDLVMPGYGDEMPLFPRGGPWEDDELRCYELPTGARLLTEAEAYGLWVEIVEKTLWQEVEQRNGRRTVVGLRGAYPGTFAWHGNAPNRFNDTIVLLWRDDDGAPHVREFPVNTETGAYNFGYHSSSALMPNRHYRYVNGWHRSYNALRMDLGSYRVRDDSNKNGHWDSDRNGWLSGGAEDHDRNGSAHNIHMGSVDGDLGDVAVNRWSAGCQVIPGMENWIEFIGNAWTQTGDEVDYFLLDTRDVAPEVWSPCTTPDGSHDCPYEIRGFPHQHVGDTAQSIEHYAEVYNCSDADEGGAEEVFVVNVERTGRLFLTVETDDDDNIDPDIHLLMGDDGNACLARGHRSVDLNVSPGRYVIVVDTWVDGDGRAMAGPYRLRVDFH